MRSQYRKSEQILHKELEFPLPFNDKQVDVIEFS